MSKSQPKLPKDYAWAKVGVQARLKTTGALAEITSEPRLEKNIWRVRVQFFPVVSGETDVRLSDLKPAPEGGSPAPFKIERPGVYEQWNGGEARVLQYIPDKDPERPWFGVDSEDEENSWTPQGRSRDGDYNLVRFVRPLEDSGLTSEHTTLRVTLRDLKPGRPFTTFGSRARVLFVATGTRNQSETHEVVVRYSDSGPRLVKMRLDTRVDPRETTVHNLTRHMPLPVVFRYIDGMGREARIESCSAVDLPGIPEHPAPRTFTAPED